jgi:hypothetical protein
VGLAVRIATQFCGATYFRIGYGALDWLGDDPAQHTVPGRPRSGELLGLLARRALFGGQHREAIVLAKQSIALDPGPESFQARAQLSLIASGSGNPRNLELAQSVVDAADTDDLGILLGELLIGPILAANRRPAEAIACAHRLFALADRQHSDHARGWGSWVMGLALASTDPEAARQHLRRAVALGRAEKNRYLVANSVIAILESELGQESRRDGAVGGLAVLDALSDEADEGHFMQRALGAIVLFLASHGRSEAIALDAYLGTFTTWDARVGGRRQRAIDALVASIPVSEVQQARTLAGGLVSAEAVALARRTLAEVAAATV